MKKRKNKIPIFKDDMEFELFHAKNLHQIKNDKLIFKKEYFNKISKELSVIDEGEIPDLVEKMISDNNIEYFKLEGLNQLDKQEEKSLEKEVLLFILKNYRSISIPEKKLMYQSSYFKYINTSNPDEMIGRLYLDLKQKGYINCSRTIFKSIFIKGKNPEKVNWLETQSSFYYFIKSLTGKKNINCSNKWVVASDCFLVKGKEQDSIQLGKVKEPTHRIKQEINNILQVFL